MRDDKVLENFVRIVAWAVLLAVLVVWKTAAAVCRFLTPAPALTCDMEIEDGVPPRTAGGGTRTTADSIKGVFE